MGGECYKFLKCRATSPTPDQQKLYERILPHVTEIVEEWKKSMGSMTGRDTRQNDTDQYIFIGSSVYCCPIELPLKLSTKVKLGWQHRRYGSIRDDNQEIADKIIELFLPHVKELEMELDEEDCIAADLGYDDYWEDSRDNDEEEMVLDSG